MKKIYSYAFAASVLMLASCSNETEPIVNGGNTVEEEGSSFIAINLCATSNSTRATGDYEYGEEGENTASKGTFLFFDESGAQTQEPQTVSLTSWTTQENGENIAKIAEPIVVVAGKEAPKTVIVVLNKPDNLVLSRSMNYETVSKLVTDIDVVSAPVGDATLGSFVMTNSTYLADYTEGEATTSKYLIGTDIEGKTFPTRAQAQAAADADSDGVVNIYVERLAAKVKVSQDGTDFKIHETGEFELRDGSFLNLVPKITGIEIANVADSEYLLKNMDSSWISNTWMNGGKNDFRSFWSLSPENLTVSNQSYTDIVANSLKGSGLPTVCDPMYVRENTTSVASNKSALLLTAELYEADEKGQPKGNQPIQNLVKYAGMYYTAEGYKACALNRLKVYYIQETEGTTTTYRNLNEDEINYLTNDELDATIAATANEKDPFHAYEQTLKISLNGETPLYVENGKDEAGNMTYKKVEEGDYKTVADINKGFMELLNRVWYWNGGKSYYFIYIEHDGADDFQYGLVRNNVYDITVQNISGLGVPVYNPDRVIIPEIPTDEFFYLAAKVNILQWRIVSHNVDFNNVPL